MERIFAIEGAWQPHLGHTFTVKPTLDALAATMGVKHVHRHVDTTDAAIDYVQRWSQPRYRNYRVLFLAFHGEAGRLRIHKDMLDLEDVAKAIGGRAEGRIVHFGACSLTRLGEHRLKAFLKTSGARAISGYRRNIDWTEAIAADTIVLGHLMDAQRLPDAARRITRRFPGISDTLGWTLTTR